MTSLTERQRLIHNIDEACQAGASLHKACHVANITLNCWYRWQREGVVVEDLRPLAQRPAPGNKLTEAEREALLAVCNSPRFASLPPSQIVPALADEGCYLASESTFYRELRKANQLHYRGRAQKPRQVATPTTHTTNAPNQVWTWDITWLPSTTQGHYYKLYLIEDVFSRFPVAWEVHQEETGELAADLLQRAVLSQRCALTPLVLHADNGAPMKSMTLKAKMEALGVTASFSRPRVSNDNPYSEALFRTLKYWPKWPSQGFASLEEARQWVKRFIDWYSHEHRHSGIKFVTPAQRHQGKDQILLQQRHKVYTAARKAKPERWSRHTRNWDWIPSVALNPERNEIPQKIEIREAA